jgi:hypothetical protein
LLTDCAPSCRVYRYGWPSSSKRSNRRRDTLSAEFETYLQLATKIADLFARADGLDSKIKDLNIASPPGEPHLYSVELQARQMTAFSPNAPSILQTAQTAANKTNSR